MTRRQTEKTIAVLGGLTAVNALGGAVYGLGGAPNVPAGWLEGSPFRDYRIPSMILGVGVGGTSIVAAVTAWRSSDRAGPATVSAGAVLVGWVGAQVAIIGRRSFLQPLFGGVGIAMVGLGAQLVRP